MARTREMRNIQILVSKPERKIPIKRAMRTWKGNNKVEHKKNTVAGWESVSSDSGERQMGKLLWMLYVLSGSIKSGEFESFWMISINFSITCQH